MVGDELRPERVPANARFVLYFDAENFKRTSLWTIMQAHQDELEVDDELDDLEEFKREFGIDPLKDVKSVLVYGTTGPDDPSAIQIVVNETVDQAISALRRRHWAAFSARSNSWAMRATYAMSCAARALKSTASRSVASSNRGFKVWLAER